MLKGWKKIIKEDIPLLQTFNTTLEQVEYFHSIIYQMYNKMVYKFINREMVICKPAPLMGKYNIIRYCNTNNSEYVKQLLTKNGITLRGHDITGKTDKFGEEFIYDAHECVKKEGKKFARFRNIIKRYVGSGLGTVFVDGYRKDIDDVVKKWSEEHKSKHQIKLLELIKQNLDLVNITRVYHKNILVGFSVTEVINRTNGVIIQRLINPDIKAHIIEPNILIHYFDCIINSIDKEKMLLNMGASRNKNIKIAKEKLRPCKKLKIRRKVSNIKLTKDDWNIFKSGLY